MNGGDRGGAGQRHAERLGDRGHGRGRAHHRAGAGGGDEAALDLLDLGLAHAAGAVLHPELAAIGAGADAVLAPAAGHLRPADELDRGLAGAGGAHELRRHGLVAAAHQHDRVHRLGADHLLGVHRHQVAELHRVRRQRRFVQRDGRELEREPAGRRDAALDRLDQLGEVAVAGIEAAVGVGDADHRARQLVEREALRARERAAHVDREIAVAVVRRPCRKPFCGTLGFAASLDLPAFASDFDPDRDLPLPAIVSVSRSWRSAPRRALRLC